MKLYVMDSDYEVLKRFEDVINTNPNRKAQYFTNTKSLVEAVRREAPDAVLMDFDMQNSRLAAKTIQSVSPDVKIVMMTRDGSRAVALFELGLNGCLIKPFGNDEIEEELFRLKHPMLAKMIPSRTGGVKK